MELERSLLKLMLQITRTSSLTSGLRYFGPATSATLYLEVGSPMLMIKTLIVSLCSLPFLSLASQPLSSSASSAHSRRIDQGVGSPMPMPMWTKRQLVHLCDHQRWSAEGSRDDQIRQMISSNITGCIIPENI